MSNLSKGFGREARDSVVRLVDVRILVETVDDTHRNEPIQIGWWG